jgi:hypothetical protein
MHTLSRLQSSLEEDSSHKDSSSKSSCDSNSSSSLFARASRYLIPESGDMVASAGTAQLETLKLLFSETLDILDTEVG